MGEHLCGMKAGMSAEEDDGRNKELPVGVARGSEKDPGGGGQETETDIPDKMEIDCAGLRDPGNELVPGLWRSQHESAVAGMPGGESKKTFAPRGSLRWEDKKPGRA